MFLRVLSYAPPAMLMLSIPLALSGWPWWWEYFWITAAFWLVASIVRRFFLGDRD